nr:MFS transporter [uncultured Duganella sp.]
MTGPGAPAPAASRWIALLVAGAFFMENLDGTIITTALPDIARSFGVAPLALNVGVSAYLLTLGVFIPISGWVAERLGGRRVFTAALALFTLASVLCGMADSLGEFVALRVLQGVGGAMMVPVGRLLVLNTTPKEQLIGVIATLTWPSLVAPVLGPPVGGFIASYLSWRWIFYLNLPLGLAGLALAWWLLPKQGPSSRRPFDWPGFVLSAGGVLLLCWGAEMAGAPAPDWPGALGRMGAGAAALAALVWHLRRAAHPLIDLGAFAIPTFAITIAGGSLFRMAITAVPFLLPLMLQLGFGLDAFESGLLVIAVFAGNLMMKPATTPILRRFGFKRVLLVNGLANVAALAACALLTPATPVWLVAAVLFVGGLARSMQFSALNTLGFADVPRERMAGANTLSSTAFQVASGLGIAMAACGVRLGHWGAERLGLAHWPGIEYRLAFLLVALVSLLAMLDALWLAPGAGAQVVTKRRGL